MNDRNQDRRYDVVVFGATGFTGTLVAEYLLRQYGASGDLRWALAGRSQAKLESVRKGLGEAAAPIDIVIADSNDEAALASVAESTAVVLTTVGPYALYGSKLVAACVEAGTHYCDLTGEPQWIRRMIDQHHERARETGARIVNCCGFDSIPSDIGVWHLQSESMNRFEQHCQRISLFVKATKGTASGGTLATMMNAIKEARADKEAAKYMVHPYSLNPEGERKGPDGRDQQNVVFRDAADSWTAPFVMASINTKVVRRSHALLGYPWGKEFRYDESVLTGKGVGGWLKGFVMTFMLGLVVLGASFSPTRRFMQRFLLAKPGEGPDRELQRTGFFNLRLIGELGDGSLVHSKVTGDQDPGYGSTSKMLSECAVCLAKDDLTSPGGILTPSSAMAEPLINRLRENAGLSFEILDQDSPA